MTMFTRFFKHIAILIIMPALVLPVFVSSGEDLSEVCQIDKVDKECEDLSKEKCRELLERCEKYYQEQSAEIEQEIGQTSQEKKTLENAIYSLRQRINSLDYQIYQNNLIIKDLGLQVENTTESIEKTTQEIIKKRGQLGGILRSIHYQNKKSPVEVLLAEEDLSNFFDDLVSLEMLNKKNKELLDSIKSLKENLEDKKKELDVEKNDLEKMVELQQIKKAQNAETKKEQEYYLALTEQEYQQQLREKQEVEQRAAEIKNRIFEMVGVPDAPTFGEAYEIAKQVEKTTNVRAELVLAVLTQESNIGKNVGQCYLKDKNTGSGVVAYNGKTVARVMKPSRDVTPFLSITRELGRDPYETPVSCPMSYGYGGAMGPAQFIPSTWIMYKNRIQHLIGRAPDPWNIKDAFMAAAVYLSDSGATNHSYNSEFNAVLCYFAGPNWYNSSYKEIYKRDYGYPVMNIVDRYESDIAQLERAG